MQKMTDQRYDSSLSKRIPQLNCTCGWFLTCEFCKNIPVMEENMHREQMMKGIIFIFILVIAWHFVGFVFNLPDAIKLMTAIVTAIKTVSYAFNR